MDLLPILKQHIDRYPAMTAQDCAKLIYQAVLGPAHLGRKGNPPPSYIANEMAQASKRDIPLMESIGNGLCRLHLDSLDNTLRPETIHGLFLATARQHQGSLEQLVEQLEHWKDHCAPISLEYAAAELQKLKNTNYAPVSHSQPFHAAYDPHYRLIVEQFGDYIPLLKAIDSRLQTDQRTLLAIDGRCGSGKTTLADFLAEIYHCDVIRMDDFFLPFEQKTPERLSEPGGNVDRERFYEQIILPYQASQPLSYGCYNCMEGRISIQKKAEQQPLLIVEGSYCLHPLLQGAYDLKVFSTCSPELQSARILKRNGETMYRRFAEQWIPMEEQYFSAFEIKGTCDFIIDSSKYETKSKESVSV